MTYDSIYELVKQIPAGQVATYGQLAALVGHPRAARLVGNAMAVCPDDTVPCHRVVDRMGNTKIAFDLGEVGVQRRMLEEEGVPFLSNGRVDLKACLWTPESD